MSVALDSDRFTAAGGGLALLRRRWSGPRTERVIALVHGFAEHSGRYDGVARRLVQRGFRVHAFDQRGHGESEGPRNHADRFELLLDDIERFLALVRGEEGATPLVLLGHSMGGLEAIRLLAERRPQVAAAVASGPALALGAGASRLRLALARALSAVAPRLPVPTGLPATGLSRDPEVVRAYLADPLISTAATARMAAELMRAVALGAGAAGRTRVPLLIIHGEADPLCDVRGSREFARAGGAGVELRTYPGLLHEVLFEPEGPGVLDDVIDWIERRVPAASAA